MLRSSVRSGWLASPLRCYNPTSVRSKSRSINLIVQSLLFSEHKAEC